MNRLILMVVLALSVFPVRAAGVGGIFGQGQTHFMLLAGNGYAFNNNYLILGAGASYYVLDGMGVGLSYENWSGGSPGISKTSPFVQYVFYQVPSVKPFVGGFYRHTAVTGQPAINSVGARAGAYFASSSNSAIGVGFVYESYLDCETSISSACSESYPEISFTFGF